MPRVDSEPNRDSAVGQQNFISESLLHAAIRSGVTPISRSTNCESFFGGKQLARRFTVDALHCKRVVHCGKAGNARWR
jgi:hypothetical protein